MAFRVVALLVFAALAALAYWALGADDGAPPVSTSSVVDPAQANAQVPLSAVGGSADEESRTDAGGTQRPQAQGLRIDSNTVFGVVELRVIVEHEGGNAPAESFRWTAVGTAMGIEPRGVSEGRVARIRVPVDVDAAVVVDCDGCRQSLPIDVALRGSQFRAVEARLRPQYERARVALRCRDEYGASIQRVVVRCDHNPQDAESQREWRTLWTRDSVATDGVHMLEMPLSGRCRFHVTPVDAGRLPLRLLPEVREVRVGDDRRVDETLVHAAGGTISLSWNDREPTPRGLSGASIRLFDAQDRPVAVNWNKGESHSDGFAIDYNALPCHAANALPEGSYTVRVQGQDLDVQKRIELRKGQEARVVFP